ncbi:MAG: SAM-dependent methyltransferase [bacterium]|nr:SAM-dependent methyltransferase [bacterium]
MPEPSQVEAEPSSFRDPSGYIVQYRNHLYRKVRKCYQPHYDHLMSSGLYNRLVQENLLISHEEVELAELYEPEDYKILQPFRVPFITYPYGWCFSQYKDAALTTLKIQELAIEYGMSLKDASAYNIQFYLGKPIFIDTLSFELFQVEKPWVAYRQFCQHFLSPLLLISKVDLRLGGLNRLFIDGIPIDLAQKLLPFSTKLRPSVYLHIQMHAKYQNKYADATDIQRAKQIRLTKNSHLGLVSNLRNVISHLRLPKEFTEWGDYYHHTNYTDRAIQFKYNYLERFSQQSIVESVCDFGANNGYFSRIFSKRGILTIALDIDPLAIESCYLSSKDSKENLYPMIIDLTNPDPSIGWHCEERQSIFERLHMDLGLALALIHHLTISNNIPFEKTAKMFSDACKQLIIEFVPKSDSKVKKLLATREDIFPHYDQNHFEQVYSNHFEILEKTAIPESERFLYWMRKK